MSSNKYAGQLGAAIGAGLGTAAGVPISAALGGRDLGLAPVATGALGAHLGADKDRANAAAGGAIQGGMAGSALGMVPGGIAGAAMLARGGAPWAALGGIAGAGLGGIAGYGIGAPIGAWREHGPSVKQAQFSSFAKELMKISAAKKKEEKPFFRRPVPRALLEAGVAAAGVGSGYVAGGAAHKALIHSGALKRFRALPPAQQAKAFRVGGTVLGLGATAGVTGVRYARSRKRKNERLAGKA